VSRKKKEESKKRRDFGLDTRYLILESKEAAGIKKAYIPSKRRYSRRK